MSVEEMIALLGQYAYADKIKKRGNGRFEAIIAALKAGQEMRVHFTPYAEAVDAAMAWDVAVKELYGEFATFNTVPQPWLEEDV